MRKFSITVNGTAYEVEVEELGAGAVAAPVVAAPAPVAAPVQAAAPAPVAPKAEAKPAAKPAAPAAAGSITISAPMPGNINDVRVSVGQAVKKGDDLIILEAMKMENEIKAPQDGTVASVNVTKGATVNTGDVLVTLK